MDKIDLRKKIYTLITVPWGTFVFPKQNFTSESPESSKLGSQGHVVSLQVGSSRRDGGQEVHSRAGERVVRSIEVM